MIGFYILLFIVACIVLYKKGRKNCDTNLIDKIPGPKTSIIPFIGNFLQLYGSPAKMWNVRRQFNKTYYPIFRAWSLGKASVHIRHPDDIEILLSSKTHISKGPSYHFFRPWIGNGLITSTGSHWYNRRKMIQPAFQYNCLKSYANVFNDHAKCLVETIKKSDIHDITPLALNLALEIICETTMDVRLSDESAPQKYVWAVHKMGRIIVERAINLIMHNDWIFSLLPLGRLHTRALKILHNFTDNIIQNRKLSGNKSSAGNAVKIDSIEQTEENKAKRVCLLDLLLQLQNNGEINDTDVRDEISTFTTAGHDTTSMAIVFTLLLLAEHKTIQDKVRAEVNDVFEECNGELGVSELQNLKYLERCIKESMRLYPIVTTLGRSTVEDLQLKKYLIPKNVNVAIHIYDVHRDSNYWPNPEVFDPDRFLPENSKGRHPYCYIPFSAGPRNCIGQKFAIMELKSTIAHLLYNFHLIPIDSAADMQFQLEVVLRPPRAVRMKFIKIDK